MKKSYLQGKEDDYMKGKENWFIRMWFYCRNGAVLTKDFQVLGLIVLGLYAVLKLTNPLWLILMIIVIMPTFTLIGHYQVHKISKVSEWLSIRFATHFAIKQYNLNEEQVKLLKKIVKNTQK